MTRTWKTWGSIAAAVLLVSGTAQAQAQSDTDPARNQRNSAAASGAGDQKGFVKKMLLANMAEIQLGQLAESQASSADVKSFAQMIVAHHTQANQQLLPLAQQLGVQQPAQLDGKHKALAARLSKLQGQEFDRAFVKAMVADHQDTIRDAQTAAGARGAAGSGITAGSSGAMGTGGMSGTTGTSGSATGSTGTSGSATGSSSTSGTGTTGTATSGSSTGTASGSTGDTTGSAMTAGSAPSSAAEYAAMTLPIVQQHLQQAQQLAAQMGK